MLAREKWRQALFAATQKMRFADAIYLAVKALRSCMRLLGFRSRLGL